MAQLTWVAFLAKVQELSLPILLRVPVLMQNPEAWNETDEQAHRALYDLVVQANRDGVGDLALKLVLQDEKIVTWAEPLERYIRELPVEEQGKIGVVLEYVIPDVRELDALFTEGE